MKERTIVVTLIFAMTFGMMLAPRVEATEFDLYTANISDRMNYHRAVDAVVWAMPLMNCKAFRDALIEAGLGPNDIGYFSKIQDWKFQTATPNNTTPYIVMHWDIKDGPIVVEIPGETEDVDIFGTLLDAWHRPIDDVGAAGRDKGRGAQSY